MPHRRTLSSASSEQLDAPTCRQSTVGGRAFPVAGANVCNSRYIGLVAVGVQELVEDILVPPLLRNCLTLNVISYSQSLSFPRTLVLAIVLTV